MFIVDNERSMLEQSRKIFFSNKFQTIKSHYKQLRDLAIKSDPKDKNYIEYLELDFNRAIEDFIKEASMME